MDVFLRVERSCPFELLKTSRTGGLWENRKRRGPSVWPHISCLVLPSFPRAPIILSKVCVCAAGAIQDNAPKPGRTFLSGAQTVLQSDKTPTRQSHLLVLRTLPSPLWFLARPAAHFLVILAPKRSSKRPPPLSFGEKQGRKRFHHTCTNRGRSSTCQPHQYYLYGFAERRRSAFDVVSSIII